MDFFKRSQRQQSATAVGGYIAYYGLTDWWLATFTPSEQDYVAFLYSPPGTNVRLPLAHGKITGAQQTAADFLSNLAEYLDMERGPAGHHSIVERIRAKVAALGGEPHPGFLNGRHYTTYVEEVKQLKRDGKLDEVERLLLALVGAVETESRIRQWPVAGWYYDELAKIYRKRKDYAAEVAILERYASQRHAPGVTPPRLLERLDKARALLAQSQRG